MRHRLRRARCHALARLVPGHRPAPRTATTTPTTPQQHGRGRLPDMPRRDSQGTALALPVAHQRRGQPAQPVGGLMSSEDPLYERDPEAWNAHLAEGNAKQARKRVSADVMLRDAHGRILLVDPKYKPDWDLPGGMAEGTEPPADAVRRELREELGLDLHVGDLLCVDWVSPHGPWDDLVNFIFDGGVLDERSIASLRLTDDELRAYDLFDEGQVKERLRHYVWRRVRVALEALTTARARYLLDGYA